MGFVKNAQRDRPQNTHYRSGALGLGLVVNMTTLRVVVIIRTVITTAAAALQLRTHLEARDVDATGTKKMLLEKLQDSLQQVPGSRVELVALHV